MTDPGYTNWTGPVLRDAYLGGYRVSIRKQGFAVPSSSSVIRMDGGASVVQYRYLGPSAPVTVVEELWRGLEIDVALEEDFYGVRAAVLSPQTTWCPELPIDDTFRALTGQTQFSLSRQAAYGLVSGVTTSGAYAPRAWLAGVEQTMVYTGTPTSGQVKFSTAAGAQHLAVTTPSIAAGTELRVRYYPLYVVKGELQVENPQNNQLDMTVDLEEILAGTWS